GADAAIADANSGGGFLSGLMPGVMGLGSKLMGAGLGMSEISGISKETIAFAREKAGSDVVDEVVNSIPGLSQFVRPARRGHSQPARQTRASSRAFSFRHSL
ncbi:hypothetical protein KC221_22585, partial [Mycobacterium tuberculosis]|nr:hypothetical protein [Mycobacterium tuberculosis]